VFTVGLTGGIGSGKSEVCRMLAELGAVVVDADRLAHEALAPGAPGLGHVVEAFGRAVLAADGGLDRGALAELVFRDPAARRRLEAIVHPIVADRSAQLLAAAAPDAIVVHDVPLLVERDLAGGYDLVVVVDAPEAVRLRRVVAARGLSPDDVKARMAAQASREHRLAVADVVLDNSGTLADLRAQVGELWSEITSRLA